MNAQRVAIGSVYSQPGLKLRVICSAAVGMRGSPVSPPMTIGAWRDAALARAARDDALASATSWNWSIEIDVLRAHASNLLNYDMRDSSWWWGG